METMLGTIEVGKLPWMALMFAAAYWKTAVAAVWGLGFTYILAKRMKAWFKEDARDAAIGMKDEDAIFANMKVLAKERRPGRTKQILIKDLFWLPLMGFNGGRKVAKVIFYPALAYLDKAQTEGLAEGQRAGKKAPAGGLLATQRAIEAEFPSAGILIEGENAMKCQGCNILVGNLEEHSCKRPVTIGARMAIDGPGHVSSTVVCDSCEMSVQKDAPHRCSGRFGSDGNGMINCKCGTSYAEDSDFDHVCPEESVGIEKPQCTDCDRTYDPTTEVHAATSCKGCRDVHCKRFDCGERV